jgi:glycosyltransferase involved in cell wall biosynthesis
MCFACPCVSTRVGGIPELVADGVTGTLVPFGDVDAFAMAAQQLIENPEMRGLMGRAGQQRAHELFSPEVIVPRYEALYRRLRGK